jgi:hypothetical protein
MQISQMVVASERPAKIQGRVLGESPVRKSWPKLFQKPNKRFHCYFGAFTE